MLAIRKTANQIALGAATGTGLFMGTKTLVDEQFHKPEIEKINSEINYYRKKTSEISPKVTSQQQIRSKKQDTLRNSQRETEQAKKELEKVQAEKEKVEELKTKAQREQDRMHNDYINKGKKWVQMAKRASLFNCLLQKLRTNPNKTPTGCQPQIPHNIKEIKKEV